MILSIKTKVQEDCRQSWHITMTWFCTKYPNDMLLVIAIVSFGIKRYVTSRQSKSESNLNIVFKSF